MDVFAGLVPSEMRYKTWASNNLSGEPIGVAMEGRDGIRVMSCESSGAEK